MQYRREIDGLRAVAVLPVIFFHGGFEIFSGGYVGVDVFFVISGYLITNIIAGEIRAGRFSLLNFYERRIRRIMPALVLVTAACIPAAAIWMIPGQQEDFARSVVAVFFFVSNVYFWRESDYFAAEAEEKPLLHTWSLAVEEQFYVIFPLLLLLALPRFREAVVFWLLAVGTLASFALAEVFSDIHAVASFYLLPTRLWELAAGALCALYLSARTQKPSELLAALGLVLILAAILLLDDRVRYPSVYALLPVVGTVLIILHAGSGTLTGRLLSTRLLVGIGLVSYSAYLWHQPLFAFARIRSYSDPPVALMLALSAATLVLAGLSWKFVEQPFRRRSRDAQGQRRVFAAWFGASAVFVLVGLLGSGSDGLFRGVFNDRELVAYLDEQVQPNHGLAEECGPEALETDPCQTGPEPRIAVWGDSFAAHLVEGIVASDPSVPVAQATMPRCGPFLGVAPYSPSLGRAWSRSCLTFNAKVLDWLSRTPSIEYVVLSSPFRAYVSEDWALLREDEIVRSSLDVGVESLRRTLEVIAALGKTPVVVSPTPQSGANIGRCLATTAWLDGDMEGCDFPLSARAEVTRRAEALLRRIEPDYRVIWLAEGMCPGGICEAEKDGVFLYFDNAHLTVQGSALLGREMGLVDRIMGR